MAEATFAKSMRKKKIKQIIDSMLQEQKSAKIVGECFKYSCDLYYAIRLGNLGDPKFVAGYTAKRMSTKKERENYVMKQRELNGPGRYLKDLPQNQPFWALGSHCWIELDGEILDPSYEWNGTGVTYYSNFNTLMTECGAGIPMEQKMFILQRTITFKNLWKKQQRTWSLYLNSKSR